MKKIIYSRADGGVSVVSPAAGQRLAIRIISIFWLELFRSKAPVPIENISRKWLLLGNIEWTETEDEFMARIQARAVPSDAINPQVVDESVIPADRTFRNALRQDGSFLIHDMLKAREIQEQRIEAARRIKMRDLLVREELGENVAAEKAAIRSINARALCQAAQTPEELKAVLPDILR